MAAAATAAAARLPPHRPTQSSVIGCAPSTLQKIEQGVRRPSRALAARLFTALLVPPAEQAPLLQLARVSPLPGLEYYGYGILAFTAYVVPMTVLFTWIATRTRGSVLLAWLFHGAINSPLVIGPPIDTVQRWWLSAAVYGLCAVIVVLAGGLRQPAAAPALAPEATPIASN